MEKAFFISLLIVFILPAVNTTRIKIINNGYENILIKLDPTTALRDRTAIVIYLQNLLQTSSSILTASTKGRAYFRSAIFLVPQSWGDINKWHPNVDNSTTFEDAGAALSRDAADIIVAYSRRNEYPYALHQGGCGRSSLRIYLPSSVLLDKRRKLSGREFVRLWSEFRYGVFPEGGFVNDEKYAVQYGTSKNDTDKITGCRTEPKRPQSYCNDVGICEKECKEECQVECEKKCKEKCQENCRREPIVSSLMDQNLTDEAIFFCEGRLSLGPNHNPVSPSKHNLLCNEEGTWFTVLRSPDFKYGNNAAPKFSSDTGLTFRFVRELEAPKVIVAIDVSSQMKKENRYMLVKNAFSHFVTTILPSGCELSVITFGSDGNSSTISSSVTLDDEASRIGYLESQPLPEEPSAEENPCLDCVLEDIIQMVVGKNSSFTSAPVVILVTATHYLDPDKYEEIQSSLQESEISLQAMAFSSNLQGQSALYDLCSRTGNRLVYVGVDSLRNLYRGFVNSVTGQKTSHLIAQEYISTSDEENIWFYFFLDNSVTKDLKVSLSGPLFSTTPLLYSGTRLVDPRGNEIQMKKRELVPSWDFYLSNPKAGTYILKTRRKLGATSPVMVSVYGSAVPNQDLISTRVWVETLESKSSPPPVQIFVEVRKGNYPIRNATVIAYIYHPQNEAVSEITLIDDGLGNVDVTGDDGIYSHYFTNFTSTGFYNVYVKIQGGFNDFSTVLKGPSSECCGSIFASNDPTPTGKFQREVGPATFEVPALSNQNDSYPPAKVTDLRIYKVYDHMVALQWTAVGNDFDTGVASFYELRLFRNRSLIRNRFSNPGENLYSEQIETTPLAEYGVTLYHLMDVHKLQSGIYYLGIRAIDEAGNAGEPSNAVALLVDAKQTVIDCTDPDDDQPTAQKQTLTASSIHPSFVILFVMIFIHLCL